MDNTTINTGNFLFIAVLIMFYLRSKHLISYSSGILYDIVFCYIKAFSNVRVEYI